MNNQNNKRKRNRRNVQANNNQSNPTQVPRPRFRGPRINFDGTRIHGKFLTATAASSANVGLHSIPVDTTTAGTAGASMGPICSAYSEYYYEQIVMRFLPNIGPASAEAGGRAYITYFDNPENIASTINGTPAAALAAVKGTANFQSFNLWESFTYRVPLTRRKKVFNCNAVTNYAAVEVVERSVQGYILCVYETTSAAITVGAWQIEPTIVVQGLVNIAT